MAEIVARLNDARLPRAAVVALLVARLQTTRSTATSAVA
jgi:hypothetical protein